MRNSFFIIAALVFLAANFYVGYRIYALLPANPLLRIIAVAVVAVGTLGFPIFFLSEGKLPGSTEGFLYRFSTSWIIAFGYFLLIFLLIDFGRLLNHIFRFADTQLVFSLFYHNWKMSLAILGGVAVLLFAGYLNYRDKRREYIHVQTEKWKPNAKPLRVVAMSDLHLGYTISADELRQWVALVNAEKPDLVLIGGDLIDNNLRIVERAALDKELQKINAPMGVYAVPGNHEFISGIKASEAFYQKAGITLLRDSVVKLENITIVGRDDYSNRHRKNLDELLKPSDLSQYTVLLDHQPQHLHDAERARIDFQFSGHTHNGQVFPLSLLVDRMFELSHGFLKKSDTRFFVSSGLGIWGGKFRIGTHSDYLVMDISR
ncbi:MAG: metallophosphoesterase [Dysgonamonadaceae bacterium]|nr:metallophosphoesterase [Dysgonamonadaceae bacterium]